MKETRFNFPVQ